MRKKKIKKLINDLMKIKEYDKITSVTGYTYVRSRKKGYVDGF